MATTYFGVRHDPKDAWLGPPVATTYFGVRLGHAPEELRSDALKLSKQVIGLPTAAAGSSRQRRRTGLERRDPPPGWNGSASYLA